MKTAFATALFTLFLTLFSPHSSGAASDHALISIRPNGETMGIVVECTSDTLLDISCSKDTIISIGQDKSFVIIIHDKQREKWHNIYVPGGFHTSTKIDISISNGAVATTPHEILTYSNCIFNFVKVFQSPYSMYDSDARTCIDSVIRSCALFNIDDSVFADRRKYLAHFDSVWKQPTISLLTLIKELLFLQPTSSRTSGTVALPESSTEGSKIRLALQAMCFRILEDEIKASKSSSGAPTDFAFILSRLDSTFKGKCKCELAGVSQYFVSPGIPGFSKDDDGALQLLLRMSGSGNDESCFRTYEAYRKIEKAISVDQLSFVQGIRIDGSEQVFNFNRDSVYILHFWGTWCQSCLSALPELESLTTDLRPKGIEVVHIAYEPKQNVQKWRTKAATLSGNNLLVLYNANAKHILNELQVTAFPTYLIVGRDGKIEKRSSYVNEIRGWFESTSTSR